MRRKFGILFQDGALFGSMSVYDNVAFPLRQHTDLNEHAIAEIVNERLSDVGLANVGDRMPNESVRRGRASAPASLARWCSSPRSCCSTSPTRGSTRFAPRCCAT